MYKLFIRVASHFETWKRLLTHLFMDSTGDTALIRAYRHLGLLQFKNNRESGEERLVKQLPTIFPNTKVLCVFDVGAHRGEYTKLLKSLIKQIIVYSFEPNSDIFPTLERFNSGNSFQLALGSKKIVGKLYKYKFDRKNELASLSKAVITDLHNENNYISQTVKVTTIDLFCLQKNIKHIHLLKIDTEGNEFEVLQGAAGMLKQKSIDLIQFEFNEMNVVKRVFLKDFYDYLPNYQFFRLRRNDLLPLGNYSALNEIFQFQNILAIRNDLIENIPLC